MHTDPDEVTALLGIQPTEAHRAGDERVPGKAWKHDYGSLRSGINESEIDAENHFSALFNKLGGNISALKELAKRVQPTISWVIEIFANEQTPNGVIPHSLLGQIYEIGATLNVSMYFDRKA